MKFTPTIIGLVGRMQSGKDTIAQMICEAAPEGVMVFQLAFAKALKQEVATACGVSVDMINANKQLYRPILQWWGTEFRRGQDSQYWIRTAENALNLVKGTNSITVVTDCRFVNEAEMLTRHGAKLVYVYRPMNCDDDDTAIQHSSELESDKIGTNYRIANDGTLADLERSVRSMLVSFGLL